MDGDDGPDRASGRIRRRGAHDEGGAADDGTYRIFGTKIFITWGEHDLDRQHHPPGPRRTPERLRAPKGSRCSSSRSSSSTPTAPSASATTSTASRSSTRSASTRVPTAVMSFGDDDGAVGYLIGEEHQGMRTMFTMMNDARLHVGLEGRRRRRTCLSAGARVRATSDARDAPSGLRRRTSSADHRAPGRPPHAHDDEGEHRGDARRHVRQRRRASTGLNTASTRRSDCADRPEPLSSLRSPRRGVPISALSSHRSVSRSTAAWATSKRPGPPSSGGTARIAPIYEGTNGIQAIDLVLRKLPMDGGKVVASYFEEIADLDPQLDDAGLDSIRNALADGLATLREATEWITSRDDPNDALAGASPYAKDVRHRCGRLLPGEVCAGGQQAGCSEQRQRCVLSGQDHDGTVLCRADTARRRGLLAAATSSADTLFAIPAESMWV